MSHRAKRLFAGVALALPALAAAAAPSVPERLLAAHNAERDRVGVPRLAWSATLAAEAQGWATHIAPTDRLEHANERGGAGENLWIGSAGYFSPEQMVGTFLAERRSFTPGRFPAVSRTGRWFDVGHYSQVIWPDTAAVGCALARSSRNDILVCRYYPAGNLVGGWVG